MDVEQPQRLQRNLSIALQWWYVSNKLHSKTLQKEQFEELEKYLNDVNLGDVYEAENNTNLQGEVACGLGGCEI